jgi:hypothetical protein
MPDNSEDKDVWSWKDTLIAVILAIMLAAAVAIGIYCPEC